MVMDATVGELKWIFTINIYFKEWFLLNFLKDIIQITIYISPFAGDFSVIIEFC